MPKCWCLIFTGYRYEIQTDDEVCHAALRRRASLLDPGNNDEAIRRVRVEARRGRKQAIACLAIHQHDKRHACAPRD
jgi:hypothetical protein